MRSRQKSYVLCGAVLVSLLLCGCNPDGSITIPMGQRVEADPKRMDELIQLRARRQGDACIAGDEEMCTAFTREYPGHVDMDIEIDRTSLRHLRERYAQRCEAGDAEGCVQLATHLRQFFNLGDKRIGVIDDGDRLTWHACHVLSRATSCESIEIIDSKYNPGYAERLRADALTRPPLDIRALAGMNTE